MNYYQGDIVLVNFMLYNPDETSRIEFKPHLAIVVSSNAHNNLTDSCYLLLISSKRIIPENTMEITNDMLVGMEMDKESYAVCHIIDGYGVDDIVKKYGKIKMEYFDKIMDMVLDKIFGIQLE